MVLRTTDELPGSECSHPLPTAHLVGNAAESDARWQAAAAGGGVAAAAGAAGRPGELVDRKECLGKGRGAHFWPIFCLVLWQG